MIALLLSLAHAGIVEDGAAAFEAGQLDQAVATWQTASLDGTPSGLVEFNLGTAHYRKGDWPRAISHLRAAARLRPRDGSVHHNLALSRAEVGMVPPPAGVPASWMAVLTAGELGLLALLVVLGGSGAVVVGRWRSRPRWPGAMAVVVGLAVGGVAATGGHQQLAHPVAVVVDVEAVARDAASVNAGERFRLAPGAEVRVEARYDGFLLVEDGRERRGWLASSTVRVAW